MTLERKETHFIKDIFWRAAQLPIVFVLVGISCIVFLKTNKAIAITDHTILLKAIEESGRFFFILAILTLLYKFFTLACVHYEMKLANTHTTASLVLGSIRKNLRVIFILLTINLAVVIVEPNDFYATLAKNFINIIIICSMGWIAIQFFYTLEAITYRRMQAVADDNRLRAKAIYTKTRIIRNIATVMVVIITVAMILMSFSSVRDIGISLLASAGFLTAIIGLSAQRTLFAMFSSLQIALSQSIKIGDIIYIEKQTGSIEEITFTYVTLKLGENRRLIIPITQFIEKPFENWSREGENFEGSFYISVDHSMPIEPLRTELTNILKNSPRWDGKTGTLEVNDLPEHSVKIRIQVSARDIDTLYGLSAEIREKLLTFMQKNYAEHFPKLRIHDQEG